MQRLVGYALMLVSTLCGNKCAECQYDHLKPGVADLEYMLQILNYLNSRYLRVIVDLSGRDITLNRQLAELLSQIPDGIVTSATLGTPHSLDVAREVLIHVDHPRISFDGPEEFTNAYRGEGNYRAFLELVHLARECDALSKLKIVYTALPGRNIQNLRPLLEEVRQHGRGLSKLLVNLAVKGSYSEKEWVDLIELGQQADVEFSQAKQWLHSTNQKPTCPAAMFPTFGPKRTVLSPCALAPMTEFQLGPDIGTTVESEEYIRSQKRCGNMAQCEGCLASCYRMPGAFLRPDPVMLLRHTLSLPLIQNARDIVLHAAGQVRFRPENRYPNCPRLGAKP